MRDKIFLITQDRTLQELEATAFVREDLLQRLLSDYPDLLAGYQMNEADPRRWLLIAREMGIADEPSAGDRWSLDHLFLDQDGTPTLVEVKRADDTRIRREVAGQMLDYAANALLHWAPEVVRQRFEDRCREKRVDPTEAVAGLLGVEPEDNAAIESFWEKVFDKLKTGQVRLVFVADRIPKELRRIIEFLNEHMKDVEVLGVEMPQYVGSGLTTIVPKVIGKTTIAEQAKGVKNGHQWDEASFFKVLDQRNGEAHTLVARRILEWSRKSNLRVWWGKGKQDGSFIPVLDHKGTGHQLFAVWTSGAFEFYFQWYKAPFDLEARRRELMKKFNAIPDVNLTVAHVSKRPSVPLTAFQEEASLDQLLATYEWFLEEVRRAN